MKRIEIGMGKGRIWKDEGKRRWRNESYEERGIDVKKK